jgi:hypothetical protein
MMLAVLHLTLTVAAAGGGSVASPVTAPISTITTWLVAAGGRTATIGLIVGFMFHSLGGHFGNYGAEHKGKQMMMRGLGAGAGIAGSGGLMAAATHLGGLVH